MAFAKTSISSIRFHRRRWFIWAFAISLGLVVGLFAQSLLEKRLEKRLSIEHALQVDVESKFKGVYSRWLDAGGVHGMPADERTWVELQDNLFTKWSSPPGERSPVGEGFAEVRAEIQTKNGDPSLVRLPPDLKGKSFKDGILLEKGCFVRLRVWPDGSIGWRVTFACD